MIPRPILLDTCAAIWLIEGRLAAAGETAVIEAWTDRSSVMVSPITAWEVGVLVSKGRLILTAPVSDWFDALLELGVEVANMPPSVLIASTELKAPRLKDPADRIVAATARAFNYRLMTRDQPLLDFAASGQMSAIPC